MPNETTVLVNVFKVEPSKQSALMETLKKNTRDVISSLKGWKSTRMIASSDGAAVVIYSEWETQADIAAMRTDERMMAYFPKIREIASLESAQGRVVLNESRSSE